MNKWVEHIKMIMHYFAIVTVAVMIVAACYITVFYGTHTYLEVSILWQILSVSFLTSLSYLFFQSRDEREPEKKQFWIRFFAAYIYVNAVVLGLGLCYEWFSMSSLPMVIGMFVTVIVAYLLIMGFVFLVDLRTTDQINQKLRERNGGK